MILKLNYVNPIINEIDCLEVQYPIIDYSKFKRLHEYNNDSDLIKILDNILKDLDCTKEYNGIRFRTTTYPIYSMFLSGTLRSNNLIYKLRNFLSKFFLGT